MGAAKLVVEVGRADYGPIRASDRSRSFCSRSQDQITRFTLSKSGLKKEEGSKGEDHFSF